MKAIRLHNYGGVDELKFEEVPIPEPGEGEARIKIEAIGVNFIDIYLRMGRYKGSLPMILGQEAGAIVDAVGPNVSEFKPGDRVAAYSNLLGAYAEFTTIPVWKLVHLPNKVSLEEAGALTLQGLTAHYLTHSTYKIKKGDSVLIHAAGGGTGQLVVQMAKMLGARVIGTVSTEEKARLAREAGADEIINYLETDFEAEVRRITNDIGVDVAYDSVGKDTFEKSLNCIRKRGMMVLFGQSSGAAPAFDPQSLNPKGSLYLTRPTVAHYTGDREELLWRMNDIFNWIEAGKLKLRIDQTFSLSNAREAHQYLENRLSKGKVLLKP